MGSSRVIQKILKGEGGLYWRAGEKGTGGGGPHDSTQYVPIIFQMA